MAILGLTFAALASRHCIRGHISLAARLEANPWDLTPSRYCRLVLMSIVQMVISACLTIFTLWITHISVPICAWTSWEVVHGNFSHIEQYPTTFIPQIVISTSYGVWWTVPVSTFIFVAFFAFGDEAIYQYQKLLRRVRSTTFYGSHSISKARVTEIPGQVYSLHRQVLSPLVRQS
ncbi:pheromone A receptor-domain-containing protein [Mycena galopus ATCC 62051]|nr:pheromone A receptor-domain-containing protein [Mycena galopus ATCC 62051]